MLGGPNVGERRLELHPFDDDSRHDGVARFLKEVFIVERPVVIQVLRCDRQRVGLRIALLGAILLSCVIFDVFAKLEDLRRIGIVDQPDRSDWLDDLRRAVGNEIVLSHYESKRYLVHTPRHDGRRFDADAELARLRKLANAHSQAALKRPPPPQMPTSLLGILPGDASDFHS